MASLLYRTKPPPEKSISTLGRERENVTLIASVLPLGESLTECKSRVLFQRRRHGTDILTDGHQTDALYACGCTRPA